MKKENKNLESVEDIVNILEQKNFQILDHIYFDRWWFDPWNREQEFSLYINPKNKILDVYLYYNENYFSETFDFEDTTFLEAYELAYQWFRGITGVTKERLD